MGCPGGQHQHEDTQRDEQDSFSFRICRLVVLCKRQRPGRAGLWRRRASRSGRPVLPERGPGRGRAGTRRRGGRTAGRRGLRAGNALASGTAPLLGVLSPIEISSVSFGPAMPSHGGSNAVVEAPGRNMRRRIFLGLKMNPRRTCLRMQKLLIPAGFAYALCAGSWCEQFKWRWS
jgi:hypothetical protein